MPRPTGLAPIPLTVAALVATHGFRSFDVEHNGVHQAHLGWAVTVTGPDLVRIQLHTEEGPSGEAE
jgi:hypothetical protein